MIEDYLDMRKAVPLLLTARELIATRGWTRASNARDAKGEPVEPSDPNAASFCAFGACARAAQLLGDTSPSPAMIVLDRHTSGCTMIYYNDNFVESQAEALAWFDRAIAAEKNDPFYNCNGD